MTSSTPCPTCHVQGSLRYHCAEGRCAWVVCRTCRGFGFADGSRWVKERPAV